MASMRVGTKTTVYVQKIVVEGSGSFPHDMLRYDNCVPMNENEIHKMVMTPRDGNEYFKERRQVTLVRYSYNGEPPTDARWRSFLWKVVDVEAIR